MRVQALKERDETKEYRWGQEFGELGQGFDRELQIAQVWSSRNASFRLANVFALQFGFAFSRPFVSEVKGQDLNPVVQPQSI
jgi:hypothetical protein